MAGGIVALCPIKGGFYVRAKVLAVRLHAFGRVWLDRNQMNRIDDGLKQTTRIIPVELESIGHRHALPADAVTKIVGRPRSSFVRAIQSAARSEEHTSELQSLMRIKYARLCLKKN